MKNYVFLFSLVITITVVLGACNSKKSINKNNLALKVEWEVISNTEADEPNAHMRIKVINNSTIVLNDKNWALYFNQPPRTVIPTKDTLNAKITRIKGDWYEFSLQSGTVLAPGDSCEINYTLSHWIIKETDAPQGLYATLYDNNKKVKAHFPIVDYTIIPFTRDEQIKRHRHDNIPTPTPEWQYHQNNTTVCNTNTPVPMVIPSAAHIETFDEEIALSSNYSIVASEELKNESNYLATALNKLCKKPFTITETIDDNKQQISLSIDNSIKNKEAYTLAVNDKHIAITAGSNAGVFYGIQSLLNTIDLAYYKSPSDEIILQRMRIKDSPRFSYRGLHLDVCRNFQDKEEIIRILDLMALYKLNKLHFYITEDEGWRIEIEEIPELTTYGSKRGHTFTEDEHLMPAYGSGPFTTDTSSYGSGFYSRADYKEIIQHAQKRHIEVIPSINFPGHARAAVLSMEARYRKYIAQGDTASAIQYRLIDANDQSEYSSVQGYTDNVVDVGLESTYLFFETVIDDIIEIYEEAGVELHTIHTGGDEVPHGVWEKSPSSQKTLQKLPSINDPKNLQSYFFKRINNILQSKNLSTAGWEEIALERTPNGKMEVNTDFTNKNVVPYVWNNFGEAVNLTYKLANNGYPVIFCGVTNLYLDMAISSDPKEPGYYWGGFVNERKVWELSPFNLVETTTSDNLGNSVELDYKVALSKEGKSNIKGLQAELWSETVKGPKMLEYYLLPRLLSFAEKSWAAEPNWESMPLNKDRSSAMNEEWSAFISIVANKELPRLNYINNGYNYRIPPPGAIIKDGKVYANHEYPGMKIYYTTNKKEPNINSSVYNKPIEISDTILLKAIDSEGKESRVIVINEK